MVDSPRTTVMRLVFGAMAAQAVGAAVRMRVAETLGDTTTSAHDLARNCDAPLQHMTRLLRALAAIGMCTEDEPGRFTLTGAGQLLRPDHPDSLHDLVRVFTDPVMLGAWPQLDVAVRTGSAQFDAVFDASFFEYLASQPELSTLFNASMRDGTRIVASSLLDCYDFGAYSHVVDVGGGDGTLVTTVLTRNPHLRGTVFDTPQGAAEAPNSIRTAGLSDRCDIVHGDFFEAVPPGADLYLLKSIIHDWDDEHAGTILRRCRSALADGGRLLILEPILPEVVPPDARATTYLSDLNMMVNTGGQERTHTEFQRLCHRNELAITAVTPVAETGMSAIEVATAP